MEKRIIETSVTDEDKRIEGGLRPSSMDAYIGQKKARETGICI